MAVAAAALLEIVKADMLVWRRQGNKSCYVLRLLCCVGKKEVTVRREGVASWNNVDRPLGFRTQTVTTNRNLNKSENLKRKKNRKKNLASPERFELSRGNPMYLAGTRLNHSAKATLL